MAALKAKRLTSAAPTNYEIEVTITRYDRGNAFARAMLVGLGQIHIDGVVRVYAQPERRKMTEFVVKKTFAWGGIYGASTSVEDVEQGFAEGVANGLVLEKM